MLALLLLACTSANPTPAADRARRLSELLAAGDAGRCAELDDAEWVGHCQNALGAPCEQIVEGPWQQECFFTRAESGPLNQGALDDCGRSGTFAQECLTHLFKAELDGRLSGPSTSDFPKLLAEADALLEGWAERGAPSWSPPWGWFWRRAHQGTPELNRDRCEALPQEARRACQREALSALRVSWRRGLKLRPELCALRGELLRLEVARDPELAWAANPDLDAAVAAEQDQACR